MLPPPRHLFHHSLTDSKGGFPPVYNLIDLVASWPVLSRWGDQHPPSMISPTPGFSLVDSTLFIQPHAFCIACTVCYLLPVPTRTKPFWDLVDTKNVKRHSCVLYAVCLANIAKNDVCLLVQHLHNGNSYLILGFCNSLIHFLSAVVQSLLPPFFCWCI